MAGPYWGRVGPQRGWGRATPGQGGATPGWAGPHHGIVGSHRGSAGPHQAAGPHLGQGGATPQQRRRHTPGAGPHHRGAGLTLQGGGDEFGREQADEGLAKQVGPVLQHHTIDRPRNHCSANRPPSRRPHYNHIATGNVLPSIEQFFVVFNSRQFFLECPVELVTYTTSKWRHRFPK